MSRIVNGRFSPALGIPYPYASIQAARRNSLAVERDGIDLAKVALQSAETLSR